MMLDLEQSIINRITQFRIQMRLTQKELGEIIEVSASFISNVENTKSTAKYNFRHIALLAENFRLKPVFFLLTASEYAKIEPHYNETNIFPAPK